MRGLLIKVIILGVFAAAGCKERYNATLSPSQTNLLVIEGFINGNGITNITLSRTVPLTDTAKFKPEGGAVVNIMGADNSSFDVKEKGNGVYASSALVLNSNQKYRLHIKTRSGGEYLSEYVAIKQTPPIDSVNWKVQNNAVQIYANTHDPQNNSRYYRWDYQETWEIHSSYPNFYKYVNGVVLQRDLSEVPKLFYCWRSQASTSILIGSSEQLSDDIISQAPIASIPLGSERLGVRYSILLQQYATDVKAYNYFKMMRNNTETLGSIFDALPSEITGNIVCVSNANEKVIGFVTATIPAEKRIFITSVQLGVFYSQNCESKLIPNNKDSIKLAFQGGLAPYDAEIVGITITGYYSSYPYCIDCTLRGTNVKPSFW
ncbi:MAG: DUF4249 domain-containing protein [Bacteroidota bacterium]|nr:DUF4249 domain-containing protein [Bacteroidota bacterium]